MIGSYIAIIAQIVWKVCEECVKVWERIVKMCENLKSQILLHRNFLRYLKLQKQTNIG